MAEHVGLVVAEDHVPARRRRPFGDDDDGVAAGVLGPVLGQQLREALHVERVLGDQAAVGRRGRGGQKGGEAGVTAEDLDDQEALVRAGRGPAGRWTRRSSG